MSVGDVFGAELACNRNTASQTQLQAMTDCDILFCNFYNVMKPQAKACPYRQQVAANLLAEFAQQVIYLNLRLRIIGQKKLRDKIKIYSQSQRVDQSGIIHLPFSRVEWARFLYADRTALSREMGRLQNEGILRARKSEI